MNLAEIRALLAFKDNPTMNCDWINSHDENQHSAVYEQNSS